MNFPKINVGNKKILTISPLCDAIDKLNVVQSFNDEYIYVFLGEICYPWNNIDQIKKRIQIMDEFIKNNSAFYILGDADLTFMNKNKNNDNNINKWLEEQNLGINITFSNNTTLTVVHGGIPANIKLWKDLISNIEVAFVKNINKQSWHHTYDGKFGYVISAHPTATEVKHYDYSSSIDIENQVIAQEYSGNGLLKTIFL